MINITGSQLVAHGVGDYILQSNWMANTKTTKSVACLAHVVTYTLPFLCLTFSWKALLFIAGTHFVIDRWRLARYVVWAKNFLAPKWMTPDGSSEVPATLSYPNGVAPDPANPLKGATLVSVRNLPWAYCSRTGYGPETPVWLATWLMIIADNTMHAICNGIALTWL